MPTASGSETRLPSETMQLLIDLRDRGTGCRVQGLCTGPRELDRREQRWMIGVVLEPGQVRGVLGLPADEFAHRVVSLADVWGRAEARALLEVARTPAQPEERLAAVSSFLAERIPAEPGPHPAVARALMRMRQPDVTRVGSLADELGVGVRQLRRWFLDHVGLPPKALLRLARFQRALVALRGDRSLVDIALDAGYGDQAHLSHEFAALAGFGAAAYRLRCPRFTNHVPAAEPECPKPTRPRASRRPGFSP